MQRSRMVLAIAECLVEPHYPEDAEKEADYILKKLERYGMLPPHTHKDIAAGGVLYVNQVVNEWDKEDEPNYGEP